MKKQVALTPVIGAAIAIVLLVAAILVVKPKWDEGKELTAEIANLEGQVQLASRTQPTEELKGPEIKVADLFRLAKAMPDSDDMPGVILELNSVASASGVRFLAIEPQPPISALTYHGVPIKLTFDGSYFDLTDFLFRLRNLVNVRDGALDANGRLYTLDTLDLHESTKGFPQVEAVMTITAYAYGPGAGLPGAVAPPVNTDTAPAETGSTETAPTETTETPAPSDAPSTEDASEAPKVAVGGDS